MGLSISWRKQSKMHLSRLLLLVLLVPTLVQAQTVIKVIDGVTVGLDSGDVVRLKGLQLPQDKATQGRARKLLVSFVLDRPVTLYDSTELGWGQSEATVKWRGIDIGNELRKKGVVISKDTPVTPTPSTAVPQSQPSRQYVPSVQPYYYVPPQPQYQYYYPGFSSYTPASAYCVGNT